MEKVSVPMSVPFMIHRHNELLLVMMGEQFIQLGFNSAEIDSDSENRFGRADRRAAGFFLVVGLLVVVALSQPRNPKFHPFNRGSFVKVMYQYHFLAMAVFMPYIAVGLELTLEHPKGFPCRFQTRDCIWMLCFVLVVCLTLYFHMMRMSDPKWKGFCSQLLRKPSKRRCAMMVTRNLAIFMIIPFALAADPTNEIRFGLTENLRLYNGLVGVLAAVVWVIAALTHFELRERAKEYAALEPTTSHAAGPEPLLAPPSSAPMSAPEVVIQNSPEPLEVASQSQPASPQD